MIHFVTYATHSEGMFEKLINNKFNIHVDVVGWGTKYTGHTDKYRGILSYLKSKKDDDIVCFVDGFDSEFVKPEKDIYLRFMESGSKVIFSEDGVPAKYAVFTKFIFPPCKNGINLNTGMYMGYVKYIKILLRDALVATCSDDQVIMSRLCEQHDFIDIDTKHTIFKNDVRASSDDPCIVSYPGQIVTWRKVVFTIKAYIQYFVDIIALVLLLVAYKVPSTRVTVAVLLSLLMFVFTTGRVDSSCVIA